MPKTILRGSPDAKFVGLDKNGMYLFQEGQITRGAGKEDLETIYSPDEQNYMVWNAKKDDPNNFFIQDTEGKWGSPGRLIALNLGDVPSGGKADVLGQQIPASTWNRMTRNEREGAARVYVTPKPQDVNAGKSKGFFESGPIGSAIGQLGDTFGSVGKVFTDPTGLKLSDVGNIVSPGAMFAVNNPKDAAMIGLGAMTGGIGGVAASMFGDPKTKGIGMGLNYLNQRQGDANVGEINSMFNALKQRQAQQTAQPQQGNSQLGSQLQSILPTILKQAAVQQQKKQFAGSILQNVLPKMQALFNRRSA